jgi:hypothetical protein
VPQKLSKYKTNVTEYTKSLQISIKNPNKHGGHSVKFTAMNSENCDGSGSKGKAF